MAHTANTVTSRPHVLNVAEARGANMETYALCVFSVEEAVCAYITFLGPGVGNVEGEHSVNTG